MFRRTAEGNIGMQTFARCANKTVATPVPKKARLNCAVTGPEGFTVSVEYNSQAHKLFPMLAKGAGEALCHECVFSHLTREDVSALRTRETQAEIERLKAEHALALARITVEAELQAATAAALETPVQRAIESPQVAPQQVPGLEA